MITKENAVQLVNEYEIAKKEKTFKEANDFVDRVISPKIEVQAKIGGHRVDIIVARGLDISVIAKIIEDNGFNLIYGTDPRNIIISW